MSTIKEAIEMSRDILAWNRKDNITGATDDLLARLCDALEEIEEIVLGLDYANDHERIQELTLLWPDV